MTACRAGDLQGWGLTAQGDPGRSGTPGLFGEGAAARRKQGGSVFSQANRLVVSDVAFVDCSVHNLMMPSLVTHYDPH